jgi:hypothetical protein
MKKPMRRIAWRGLGFRWQFAAFFHRAADINAVGVNQMFKSVLAKMPGIA